ncbi:acyltransferase family protein [Winslowiella toletana]|uniref:acyltransferase family protein n=1 Tax=Winslowiella toletana TaxID=92490 RepID=UPI0003479959
MNKNRLFYIDFIRAISLIMVIIFHFFIQISIVKGEKKIDLVSTFDKSTDLGSIAVGVFVIVSGFSLMNSNLNNPNFNPGDFYLKRFLSIYPSFWLSYSLAALSGYIYYGHLPNNAQAWTLIFSFIGLDGLINQIIPTYYMVGEWFLGMIIILYILFPLMLFLIKINPLLLTISALTISIITNYYYTELFTLKKWTNPIFQANLMIFGMNYCYYSLSKNNQINAILFITGFTSLFILEPLVKSFIYPCLLFILLAYLGNHLLIDRNIARVISFIAKYSFATFLVHHKVIFYISQSFNNINNPIAVPIAFITSIIISLVIGFCVTNLCNKIVKKILS